MAAQFDDRRGRGAVCRPGTARPCRTNCGSCPIDEVLDYLTAAGEFRYIIEIKDGGETGLAAADQLYATLQARDLLDRVIIGSFRDEVAAYITANYPDTHRSASPEEVVQFYFAALTGKKDFTCSYDVLQLPFGDARESYGLNLGRRPSSHFAHAHDPCQPVLDRE